MVRCPTKVDLERFLHGNLSVEERSVIETHHDDCVTCQRWLKEARADEALVPELRRGRSGPTASWVSGAEAPAEFAEPSLARYRVVRRIGAGGMGVVFEAEQQNPRRRVALKVLRPAGMSERALRRFEHECETLGRLEHPSIAQIVEAGTFESHGEQVPFFAMELVEGRPLVTWARDNGLSLNERLALLLEVTDAIQYAHQQGVIHRDLKPANILVTAEGRAKVLDFGVARSFDVDDPAKSLVSHQGEIVGTLPYMSPEQLAGDRLGVDTRADVYALGVILYELLGGRQPYDLSGCSVADAIKYVEERTPQALSTFMADIPRDLEVIAGKALEKDKLRRYASAEALAEDVRRHLRHEPIEARAPSTGYLVGKFVRRHRTLVGGIVLAFAALALGMWTTWRQAERARRAESTAQAQAIRAIQAEADVRAEAAALEDVNVFLQSLIGFDPADPDGALKAGDVTLEEVALDAEELLDAGGLSDGMSETKVRIALGNFFVRNGHRERGVENLERAVEVRRELEGVRSLSFAQAANTLGSALAGAGRLDEAEARFQEAMTAYEHLDHPDNDAKLATTIFNLGMVAQFRGKLKEARTSLERSVELYAEALGPDDLFVATSLGALGGVLARLGEREEAVGTYREALEVAGREGNLQHPRLVQTAVDVGQVLAMMDRFEEAREALLPALETVRAVHDARSEEVAKAAHVLAKVERDLGNLAEAESLAREAVSIFRDHTALEGDLAYAVGLLGGVVASQGRDAEALPLFEEALELQLRHRPRTIIIGSLRGSIGRARLRLGKYTEAERDLAAALERFAGFGAHSYESYEARALADHGQALYALGRVDESRGRFVEALAFLGELGEDDAGRWGEDLAGAVLSCELDLLLVRCDLGELEGAAPFDALLRRASAELGPDHPVTARAGLFLGRALANEGRTEAADRVLIEARVAADERLAERIDLHRAGVAMLANDFQSALELLEGLELPADLPEDEAGALRLAAMGRCLTGLGRYEEAEALLLDCLAGIERFAFDEQPLVQGVLADVIALFEAAGDDDSAAEYRERLR